jgi:hypothetical protein
VTELHNVINEKHTNDGFLKEYGVSDLFTKYITLKCQEKFEDTKGVIRRCKTLYLVVTLSGRTLPYKVSSIFSSSSDTVLSSDFPGLFDGCNDMLTSSLLTLQYALLTNPKHYSHLKYGLITAQRHY